MVPLSSPTTPRKENMRNIPMDNDAIFITHFLHEILGAATERGV